jgi:AcrR family transcriptional regulator
MTLHPEIIEPTHKKGRDSQDRIVQATLTLIETLPFDQLTIASIMEEAGMAVGTFYRRFKSKQGVLPFVFKAYDDLFVDWARGFTEAGPTSPDEMIELVVRRTGQLYSMHAGLIRTVHLYDRLHPEMRSTKSDRRGLYELFGAVLAKDVDYPTKDDLTRGRMAMLTMVSVMTEHFLYSDHSPASNTNLRNRDVQDLLIRMLRALKA